jgi:hypothetical protein
MECLGYLSALDHNHHVHRSFMMNERNEPLLKKTFNPRSKTFSVCGVRTNKDYGFVRGLISAALHNAQMGTSDTFLNATFNPTTIAPHVSSLQSPDSCVLFKKKYHVCEGTYTTIINKLT